MEDKRTGDQDDSVRRPRGRLKSAVLTGLGGRRRHPGPVQRAARLMLVAVLLLPQVVVPAVITVDGTDSTVANDGVCSLREAINNANSNSDTSGGDCTTGSGPDTIVLENDVTLTELDNNDRGLPLIVSDITVEGGGSTVARDAAAPDFAIFAVEPTGTLSLNNTTVSNGYTTFVPPFNPPNGFGGGIHNNGGVLSLTNSTLSGNTAFTGGGLIALSYAKTTLINSTVSGNTAFSNGGGIAGVFSTETIVTDSTLSGNYTTYAGGGLFVYASAATVTNSTLSGNFAAYGGGAYAAGYGTMTLRNSTVVGNTNTSVYGYGAGGVYANAYAAYGYGYADLENTVVAANTGGSGDCGGIPANDLGNNFSSDLSCPGSSMITPDVDIDTTLADNGGPTETHALLADSVAIDAGPCPLDTDQRGLLRDVACDSGSYEFGAVEVDLCPGTVIPESVPTRRLGVNRYALVDDDGIFDTTQHNRRRHSALGRSGPATLFTVGDTGGCSCEQIIDALGLGNGHRKFGCSIGVMRTWVDLVSGN